MTAKSWVIVISILAAVVATAFALIKNWTNKKELRCQRYSGIFMSLVGIAISIAGIAFIGDQIMQIDHAIGNIGNVEKMHVDKYVENEYVYQGTIEEAEPHNEQFAFVSVKNLSSGHSWMKRVRGSPGDTVSIRLEYLNMSDMESKGVSCSFILPDLLEYIPGTMILHSGSGVLELDSGLGDINIGDYKPDASSIIMFEAKIKDYDYGVGKNVLRSWIQVYETDDRFSQDFADVCIYVDE